MYLHNKILSKVFMLRKRTWSLQVLFLNLKNLLREIDSLLAYPENQIPVAAKYTNCHEFLAR